MLTRKNAAFKAIHKNQSCFILCTGPSILRQDLLPLSSNNCIAVSNFYLHPNFRFINPKYYCLAPWHPPHDRSEYIRLVHNIANLSDQLNLFLDLTTHSFLPDPEDPSNCPLSRSIFFVDSSGSAKSLLRNGIDLVGQIIRPQSVSIMALQLAIYLGFDKIFLLGCDHDSILNVRTNYANNHFYDESKSILTTDTSTFTGELYSLYTLWKQYELIKSIVKRLGIDIFNATPNSLLDLFPAVSLEQALSMS